MQFYAYKPREDGTAPLGTENKMLFELKTWAGAIRRARRYLGETARVHSYSDFFDDETFHPKLINGTMRNVNICTVGSCQNQTMDKNSDVCKSHENMNN